MTRHTALAIALLSAACAAAPPAQLSLAVEATLGCVVSVVEEAGYREESRWRGSDRYAVRVRFRRAGDELTVTVDEDGQGVATVSFSRGGSATILLQRLVRNRCLP